MNDWKKLADVVIKNGTYYELAFYQPTVKYVDGVVVQGSFIHQGILKYDDGFKIDSYWLRPTPTHVKELILTTPLLDNLN